MLVLQPKISDRAHRKSFCNDTSYHLGAFRGFNAGFLAFLAWLNFSDPEAASVFYTPSLQRCCVKLCINQTEQIQHRWCRYYCKSVANPTIQLNLNK